MSEYHKIQTVFMRDPATKHKTLLQGQFSLPEFDYLQSNQWAFTEKVDGTNIRVYIPHGIESSGIEFRGKTDNAQIPAKLVAALQAKFLSIEDDLRAAFPEGATLYGEGYGTGIQSGGNYRPDQSFVLFDVSVGGWLLQRQNVENIATSFAIDIVPVVGHGTLHDMVDLVKAGFKSQWGEFVAEGVVARPTTELRTRSGHRVITKLKHKDFVHGT